MWWLPNHLTHTYTNTIFNANFHIYKPFYGISQILKFFICYIYGFGSYRTQMIFLKKCFDAIWNELENYHVY